MSEIKNEPNRVELSSCTLPNFEKRAAKTFSNSDQTISWWRFCREGEEEGGGGSTLESTCSSAWILTLGNGSFGAVQAGIQHADRCARLTMVHAQTASIDLWLQEMLTFLEMYANGRSEREARAWTCLKAMPSRSKPRRANAFNCHGRPAGLHAHYVLLVHPCLNFSWWESQKNSDTSDLDWTYHE